MRTLPLCAHDSKNAAKLKFYMVLLCFALHFALLCALLCIVFVFALPRRFSMFCKVLYLFVLLAILLLCALYVETRLVAATTMVDVGI